VYKNIIASSGLHLVIIILATLSLPYLSKKPIDLPPIISIELIQIADKTNIPFDKTIRVGGLVKMNSISQNETSINFIITDLKKEIIVSYNGLVPNLSERLPLSGPKMIRLIAFGISTNEIWAGVNLNAA